MKKITHVSCDLLASSGETPFHTRNRTHIANKHAGSRSQTAGRARCRAAVVDPAVGADRRPVLYVLYNAFKLERPWGEPCAQVLGVRQVLDAGE